METIWSHLNLIHLYPLSHIQFNIIADLYFTNFIKKKFRSGGGGLMYWVGCTYLKKILLTWKPTQICLETKGIEFLPQTLNPISLDSNVVDLLDQIIWSLKYQRFTTLGFKDIGIINSEFVAKAQFFFSIKVNSLNSIWERSRNSDRAHN